MHAAAKHLTSYQQMHVRYSNHNVNNLMNKLSSRDKVLFDFDMSSLSWDDYFDKYLRGLRVYLMGNRLHMSGTHNNTINRYILYFENNEFSLLAKKILAFWKSFASVFIIILSVILNSINVL